MDLLHNYLILVTTKIIISNIKKIIMENFLFREKFKSVLETVNMFNTIIDNKIRDIDKQFEDLIDYPENEFDTDPLNDMLDILKLDAISCTLNTDNYTDLINYLSNKGNTLEEIKEFINGYLSDIYNEIGYDSCTCICYCDDCYCYGGDGPSVGLAIVCTGCDGGCDNYWCSCFG